MLAVLITGTILTARAWPTGASLSFNLAGILGGSLAPYIATWLAANYGRRLRRLLPVGDGRADASSPALKAERQSGAREILWLGAPLTTGARGPTGRRQRREAPLLA